MSSIEEKFGVKKDPEVDPVITDPVVNPTDGQFADPIDPEVDPVVTPTDEPKSIWEENSFESREAFMEDYLQLKDRHSKFDELEKTLEQKNSELFTTEKTLSEQIQALKDKQVMYNDDEDLIRLNVLKNTDEAKYKEAASMLFGNTDPMSVLTKAYQEKYADLDKQDVEEIIKEKFNLDLEKPSDEFDEEATNRWKRKLKMNQANLKEAADDIIAKQREEFSKIELPYNKPKSKEQFAIEQVNAQKEWTPYYDKVPEAVGKIERTVKVGQDETIDLTLELDDEQKAKYSKMMSDYVYDNAISATEQNAEKIGAMLREVIERDQKEKLLETMAEKINQYYADYWDKKTTNPSTDRPPKESSSGSDQKKGLNALKAYWKNNH